MNGIFGLLFSLIFLGACVLPFWFLYKFWPSTGRMGPFRPFVAPVAFVAVLLWGFAMFHAFRHECRGRLSLQRIGALEGRPRGMEVRGWRDTFRGGYDWSDVLKGGSVDFVDEQIGTRTMRYCRMPDKFNYSTKCDSVSMEHPSLLIDVKEPRQLRWWAPALQVLEYEVREAGTGRLLARASDTLFGGGIASPFLRLLGGDQDFDRLSCRYASASIGPWRPTLSGRPGVAQYGRADINLLEAVLP